MAEAETKANQIKRILKPCWARIACNHSMGRASSNGTQLPRGFELSLYFFSWSQSNSESFQDIASELRNLEPHTLHQLPNLVHFKTSPEMHLSIVRGLSIFFFCLLCAEGVNIRRVSLLMHHTRRLAFAENFSL